MWIDYKALLYFFVDSGEDTGVKEVNPFAQLMADLSGYSQYSKVWISWTMKFTDGFDNFFSLKSGTTCICISPCSKPRHYEAINQAAAASVLNWKKSVSTHALRIMTNAPRHCSLIKTYKSFCPLWLQKIYQLTGLNTCKHKVQRGIGHEAHLSTCNYKITAACLHWKRNRRTSSRVVVLPALNQFLYIFKCIAVFCLTALW